MAMAAIGASIATLVAKRSAWKCAITTAAEAVPDCDANMSGRVWSETRPNCKLTAQMLEPPIKQDTSAVSTTFWARYAKRAFDLVVTLVFLFFNVPGLVVAAILIKLTSRGPLLFVQQRAGKDGVPFRTVKFRTMKASRRPDPKELVPLDHADITPVGQLLRRLKIDELPQLFNVIAGQMSLIGPRPTLPDQVAEYDDFRRQRLLVRPGITGLAQVNGNTSVPWDERILFDVAYVRRCSFLLDMGILLRTLLVVLVGEARTTRDFCATRYARFVDIPAHYAGASRSEQAEPGSLYAAASQTPPVEA